MVFVFRTNWFDMFGKRNYYFLGPKRAVRLENNRRKCFLARNNRTPSAEHDHHRMKERWGLTELNYIRWTFLVACKCAVNCCHCSSKFSKIHFIEFWRRNNIRTNEYNAVRNVATITKSFSRTFKRNDDSVSVMATIVLNILLFGRSHMTTCTIVPTFRSEHTLTHTHRHTHDTTFV